MSGSIPGDENISAIFGLSGLNYSKSNLRIIGDRIHRIKLPEKFSITDMHRMQKDFEEIIKLFHEYPDEMLSIYNAIAKLNIKEALSIAKRIGLSEERFSAQGGGILWGLVAVVVVVVIVATEGEAE